MELKFTKMHGCGNDYIYFDCINNPLIANPNELSVILSDRHYGIGGDGIILICKSDVANAKMRMFNLDGSEGKMCGNGIRCVAKYLFDNKIVTKKDFTIETLSGIKKINIKSLSGLADLITVDMGAPNLNAKDVPVNISKDFVINHPLKIGTHMYNITCVSMGNPHCVVFCDYDIEKIDINKIGPLFENNEIFPEKVNAEFVQILNKNTLKMRVWERGSGETFACGTGACASAVAAVENKIFNKNEEINVILKGGELSIKYTDETVYMTGNAEKVFDGIVDV